MKFAVGVLTHNAILHDRFDLLKETLQSLSEAFPGVEPILLDNGSSDGTELWVSKLGGVLLPYDENNGPGRGDRALANHLVATGADVVVLSDDDMFWKPGAMQTLERFWSKANWKVVPILGGYLEPEWPWNTPISSLDVGAVRVLLRRSAPACAWTFLPTAWNELIAPLVQDGFGHDFKVCEALFSRGHCVGQIDLAEHRGWGRSTYGNNANEVARPLDRAKWGV
jgi:glycosyltransferase involved in cell wall biosynthesis